MEYNPDKMKKHCKVCEKSLNENEGKLIVFIGVMCEECYKDIVRVWNQEQLRYKNAKNSSVCK